MPQAFSRAVTAFRARQIVEAEKLLGQILAVKADYFDALHLLAVVQATLGKSELALASVDRALALRPNDAGALNNRGITLQTLRRADEALACFDRALRVQPDSAETHNNRGNALRELGRATEALASYDRALVLRANFADALNNRGVALQALARYDGALASFERALAIQPNYAKALYNRGNTLKAMRRLDEALASYDQAAAVQPNHAEALFNRGVILHERGQRDAALASYDSAIAARPNNADAYSNRGVVLHELSRFDEALATYDRALAVRPDHGGVLFNRGNLLQEMRRSNDAVASYDRALALRPNHVDALVNRANTLVTLKRFDEALANFDSALAVQPTFAKALSNRGHLLHEMHRIDEALASYEAALAADPDDPYAFSGAANCAAKSCDWERWARFAPELPARVADEKSIVAPFVLLGYSDDPALQLRCAVKHVENKIAKSPPALWTGQRRRHDKIRVAYLSADFSLYRRGVSDFEKHDRSRFDIIGVSYGVDGSSEIGKRLVESFDQFHDVRMRSDREVAKLLFDLEIDIAVDRQGHTLDSRTGILAHRAAPIQVNYLAYPGTLGAEFIDYIVADKTVAPFEHGQFYTEKIVHLPDCYQVNDAKRPVPDATPTRREMGLPERGFVFCCFNNNWKITPAIFDIWMRLLHRIEGSVLWLLHDDDGAERNLRREARQRGIDPARLVFARRIPLDRHLARHRLADLFLDTVPYNAHTTASDALAVSTPVLTCLGNVFAARVAASMLHAVGLPELIASDLAEYEALALKLAQSPMLMADIKARLQWQRDTLPLFDTDRYARHLEAAYTTMWEMSQRGEAPRGFTVPLLDSRQASRPSNSAAASVPTTPPPTPSFDRALAAYRGGQFIDAEKICGQILAAQPDAFDALHLLAAAQMSRRQPDLALANLERAVALRPDHAGVLANRASTLQALKRFDAALASFDRALALRPDDAEIHHHRGNLLNELGRDDEAVASYDRAIALRANYADALNNRGVALHRLDQFGEALASFDRALALRPDYVTAHYNSGNALRELRRFDEALAAYDRVLAGDARHAQAHYNRGLTLHDMARYDDAVASYDQALSLQPGNAGISIDRGTALYRQQRFGEALASYDRALAARPGDADALINRGNALKGLNRYDEALASYDRALAARRGDADALNNRGFALQELRRPDEALASYDQAVAARPRFAEALNNRGNVLRELRRPDEALASYDRALALDPDYADPLHNRGNVLQDMNRLDEALASYERAWAKKNPSALGSAADCAGKLCDWDRRARFAIELPAHVSGGKLNVSPFMMLGYSDDPALHLRCAQNHIAHHVPLLPPPLWTGATRHHDKIRVAYLSADFRNHPMASLITGLFETHDRAAFEISGISFGVDDGSDARKRVVAAFDRFHDVARRSDREIAMLLHDLEIDIAIDLMGYTKDARPGILAHRPAPLQVNYLGYPGTMGTPLIDYIIADKIVAPFERGQFYTEKLVHLPDCSQANDDKRPVPVATPTRRELGLPEHGFVFCCFNNNWKITPAIFDIWMRLLHRVEGSVLWLLRDNDGAERNLRQEAARRGIDPSRLVFAARIPLEAHLARHRLADLFLDTLPYNAHTTASDALWLGLPVVTSMGQTFAARVAASILHAIGMPELIAADLAGYEALALRLAHDPALLASTKAKLARNRDTHPLVDTGRFARHIEDAYRTMWDIHQRGETPRSFAVPPTD